jgi:protein-S-isoprenylcysteine O-methyltransferase Ste14
VNVQMKLIVIIGFSYLYAFYEIYMNMRQRRKSVVRALRDKGSLWVLYISITIGYILSFSIGSTRIGRIYHWDTFFGIGVVMVVLGLIVRIQSMVTLNNNFTYSVSKVEGHKLVESGIYKKIRHPGYLGQLIIFVGISVSMSNWLSVLFMVIPISIGYNYRVNVEERFMLEQFGQDYLNYKNRTKKIIPMIY